MNFIIKCEYNGKVMPSLNLTEEGVYYVAIGEDKLRPFKNPTSEKHFILILHKGSAFVVKDNVAKQISAINGYASADLKLSFSSTLPLFERVTDAFFELKTRLGSYSKLVIIGAVSVVIIVVALFQFVGGKDEAAKSAVVEIAEGIAEDEKDKIRELIEMRFKIAKKAVEQGRFKKAIGIIEKIIKIDPKNEAALSLLDNAKKGMKVAEVKSKEELALDVWIQQNITEVSKLMADNDFMGAEFKLRQVISRAPDHSEAAEMMRKIKEQLAEENKKSVLADHQKEALVSQAEEHFKIGKRYYEEENWLKAYKELRSAVAILDDNMLHPSFEVDLVDVYKLARKHVETYAGEIYASAEESFQGGNGAKSIDQKAKLYRSALKNLGEVKSVIDGYDTADLKNKVLNNFNDILKPIYSEALTLQELEGCCYAKPKLDKVMQLAQSSEIQYYKMSKEALEKCPCKR